MTTRFRTLLLASLAVLAVASVGAFATWSLHATKAAADRGDDGSVAARLGGQEGIRAFLEQKVVPAVLADPELAPFFRHLTETPGDIEDCLSRLLDHDLGGRSAKNGAVTATGHVCRSSMSNVHHDMGITDVIRGVEIQARPAVQT